MVADGLLTRQRYREVPPRVDYELSERARELMPVLGALARWGFDWAWSAPRHGEAVDVGAVLRLAPGLLEPSRGLNGRVECIVEDDNGDRRYVLVADGGHVEILEREAGDGAQARVSGTEEAWVRALGPDADAGALEVGGDRGLAEELLGGLTTLASRAAA
jgi:hypothetical protein